MGKRKTFKRHTSPEHFTKCLRSTMETPAWRALSTTAQALYPWLKLEWKGAEFNNNGKIQLSVRQAAEKMGISTSAATKAFWDLQAKGFLLVKTPASLGVGGNAKGHSYILTEIGYTLHTEHTEERGKQLFREWRAGHDYEVVRVQPNNPKGRNGREKQNPIQNTMTNRPKNDDGSKKCVTETMTGSPENEDSLTRFRSETVLKNRTSLSTIPIASEGLAELSVSNGLGLCGKAKQVAA